MKKSPAKKKAIKKSQPLRRVQEAARPALPESPTVKSEPAPVAAQTEQRGLVPFDQLKAMAQALGAKKLFGKSADELLPLMLIAQAEGLHPATAAQEYDIIQGKPAINSRAALARFQRSGGKIGWITRTDKEASARFEHPSCIGAVEITWTMERARQANLTGKTNWRQYPAQMLSARVVAEGVRACYPACLSGLYTVEEVQDFSIPRNITPGELKKDASPPGRFDPPVEVEDAISADPVESRSEIAGAIDDPVARVRKVVESFSWKGRSTDYKWVIGELAKGFKDYPNPDERADAIITHIQDLALPPSALEAAKASGLTEEDIF